MDDLPQIAQGITTYFMVFNLNQGWLLQMWQPSWALLWKKVIRQKLSLSKKPEAALPSFPSLFGLLPPFTCNIIQWIILKIFQGKKPGATLPSFPSIFGLLPPFTYTGCFFNWASPEFAKCWPVSNWFQKNVRVPDWPPPMIGKRLCVWRSECDSNT